MLEELKNFESLELTVEESEVLNALCENFSGGCGRACLGCLTVQ